MWMCDGRELTFHVIAQFYYSLLICEQVKSGVEVERGRVPVKEQVEPLLPHPCSIYFP